MAHLHIDRSVDIAWPLDPFRSIWPVLSGTTFGPTMGTLWTQCKRCSGNLCRSWQWCWEAGCSSATRAGRLSSIRAFGSALTLPYFFLEVFLMLHSIKRSWVAATFHFAHFGTSAGGSLCNNLPYFSLLTLPRFVCSQVQSYLEWPGVQRALGVELSTTRAKRAAEAWEALLLSDEAGSNLAQLSTA